MNKKTKKKLERLAKKLRGNEPNMWGMDFDKVKLNGKEIFASGRLDEWGKLDWLIKYNERA